MSLSVCIPDLIEQGKIPKSKAREAQRMYEELLARYDHQMGDDAAKAMATQKTVEAMERAFLQKKRQALLQVAAQDRLMTNARERYAGGQFKDGPLRGDAMLANLVRDERAPYANVEYRWRNVKQTALATMYDLLAKHRANIIGQVREKSDLTDVLRELFGADTGNLNARELADGWRGAAEYLRRRFNAAGGAIGKLEDWGLPHSHDPMRVGSVSKDQWISEVGPALERSRMIDNDTGLPMNDKRLTETLGEVYDTIVSDGWNKKSPGAGGQSSMGNRRAEHRFLHFKSADDWMAYNDRFGTATPLDAMMGHVEYMSRDIAMMEILGPNPAATVRWMKDSIAKDVHTIGRLADRMGLRAGEVSIDRVFNEITGVNNIPVNRRIALVGSTIRNWQSSTKLGGAVISSLSDAATQALTRHYNGLSATSTLTDMLKAMNPFDPADREFARRASIIGDEFTGKVIAGGRAHMDELFGGQLAGASLFDRGLEKANEMSRRLADGVLTASGLNAWTVAGREAMYREFAGTITDYAGKAFDDLPPPFANFLRRYGMDAASWDKIRAADRVSHKGMEWIDPSAISDEALRDRLMEGILTEMDFAVPTGGLAQKAMIGRFSRGDLFGEIVRTGFQFKMFPVTVMSMHAQRLMSRSNLSRKASYGAAFLGATTLMGATSFALSEMLKGKDPQSALGWDFWYRAMLKGGGLGLYGDVIQNGTNEYGQSWKDITAGPAWSTGDNLSALGRAAWKGKGVGKATANLLKREVPGSSLWYLRLAYERLLVDTVGEWADPEYKDSYKRIAKRAEQEGSGLWWAPGASAPDRGPEINALLMEPPPESAQ
ncbi:hypothetical protein AI27_11150 [Sphingomonas sp. BHC-A]|nr:hypothetical protein AI27_11150 [Sphingomonas sp. BHC-A]